MKPKRNNSMKNTIKHMGKEPQPLTTDPEKVRDALLAGAGKTLADQLETIQSNLDRNLRIGRITQSEIKWVNLKLAQMLQNYRDQVTKAGGKDE